MTTSKRTFRMFIEEELGEFPHFLVWAILEWMLIISLYLDGFLSCIANKFADIFELDPPCVLCTRVDHALSGKNPNSYYNESICDSHKKDISSFAYCHVHRKLSDIRSMCEGCLFSFATEKDSDSKPDESGTSHLEVGSKKDDEKISRKPEKKIKDKDTYKIDEVIDANRCSCCGEPMKPKQSSKDFSRSLSNLRGGSSLLSTSSPRVSSSLFQSSSPRASSLFPSSSPRASSLFPSSSPRAASLFQTTSPRVSSSLFPISGSPRTSASLFPTSSPRASSTLFPSSSPRTFSSLAPMASPRAQWRMEEGRSTELVQARYTELKFASDSEPELVGDDYGLNTNMKQIKDVRSGTMPDSEEMNEDSGKTPSYVKGNKFFGIPLTESIIGSPRWANKPPKKLPVDKSDLISENVDEPSTDSQALVQQLKKQINDNRKTLITLFMELDEERSAAAVAANNAMAMITRLQAEKAGVHMEALQYQRMMDEQAEYDEEAIQILRDLYLKKEEDVKVLEAELDAYRDRYGELKNFDSDEYDIDVDEYYDEFQPRSFSSFGEKSEFGSLFDDHSRDGTKKGNHEESSLNFEAERSHLFGMLKDFENHVCSSSQEKYDHEDKHTGKGTNAMLRREVSLMREKLTAIEAESGFLKHTAMTLEKGDEGTKLLTEIAEHLRKLSGLDKPDDTNTMNEHPRKLSVSEEPEDMNTTHT